MFLSRLNTIGYNHPMYDTFRSDYDRFVNWHNRLSGEMPFLEATLRAAGAARVLDAACGTGMHAIALAQRGFSAAGADLSAGMIEQARMNAKTAGVDVRFEAAGFGDLAQTFGAGNFDALLCLGNSLPHLLSPQDLTNALRDFAACLQPGGLLLVQNRNFDAVTAQNDRWMEPQAHCEGEKEWLFLRFYDFLPDGLIDFNVVTLTRDMAEAGWQQQVRSTRLYPLRQSEMSRALEQAGFGQVTYYGGMNGSPFDPGSSGNLVVVARLSE